MSIFKELDIEKSVPACTGLNWDMDDDTFGLFHALDNNPDLMVSSKIIEVYHGIGEDFEEDVFHWLCKLENGNIAHIWGSCGVYTGWEICGELFVEEFSNLTDAFHDMGIAKNDVNGVQFKDIFYKEVIDKIADEEIEKILTEEKS